MSLDVYLTDAAGREVYADNITHNLAGMASAAGIYEHLWHPERLNITRAGDLIEPVKTGLCAMVSEPAKFKAFDSENGWGTYKHFIPFVLSYLEALQTWPDATVRTWT